MMNQEWMQFESTGKIADYLAYNRITEAAHENGQVWDLEEREERHGADHCAHRYGAIRDSRWGL